MSPLSILAAYILIRALSFITYFHPLANQLIAAGLIITFSYFCFKNLKLAWLLLLTELLIDGAGHFFELHGLLLRTWWLGIFGLTWLVVKIKDKQIVWPTRSIAISLIAASATVGLAAINGFFSNHPALNIAQDAILFCFLGLLFPALEWKEVSAKPLALLLKAWILGSTFFSLITFFIYSSGLGYLPDTYYHWFRNVASGKITDLGNFFFRIVLPEQLFIIPIILVLVAYLIQTPKNKKIWAWLIACLVVLALNFSRIYFLALFAGLVFLAIKHSFKRWLMVSTITVATLLVIFSSLHLVASRGASSGLELLGLRAGGTAAPTSDVSGAIRLAILPDAWRQIQEHPWFGSGLGASVTYTDPVSKELVTRTQFDWGYLEMLAELGIMGTLIFLGFLLVIFYELARISYASNPTNTDQVWQRGLFAGAIALGVMNLTTPALFHGFGILYVVLLITVSNRASRQSPV